MNGRDVRGVLGGLTTALTLLLGLWFGGLGSSQGALGSVQDNYYTSGATGGRVGQAGDADTYFETGVSSNTLGFVAGNGRRMTIASTGVHPSSHIYPLTNNTYQNGGSSNRWSQTHTQILYVGGLMVSSGTGDPEAAITAPTGSLYLRTSGGSGTTLYVKESGTGNTGWVGK